MQILGQALDEIKHWLELKASGKLAQTWLRTGFPSLDRLINGYCRGEIAIVAGRPGMGVTSFLMETAINMSQQHGYRGVFLTVEHTELILKLRALSTLTNIPIDKLLIDYNDLKTLEQVKWTEDQSAIPLYLHMQQNRLLEGLLNEVKILLNRHPIDFVIIDSLQSLTLSDRKNYRSEYDLMNEIMIQINSFVREHNVAMICGSRLNRKVENRGGCYRPQITDIKSTSMIEEIADKILLLYRPIYYGIKTDYDNIDVSSEMEVIVPKNFVGRTGSVTFFAGKYKNHHFRIIDTKSDNIHLKKFIEDMEDPPF